MDSLATASDTRAPDPRKTPLYVVLAVAAGTNLIGTTVLSIHEGHEAESFLLRMFLPACAFLEYALCYVTVAWDSLITIRSGFLITTGIILTFVSGLLTVMIALVSLFGGESDRYGKPFLGLLFCAAFANLVFVGHASTHAQRIYHRTTVSGVLIGVAAAIVLPCSLFAWWKHLA